MARRAKRAERYAFEPDYAVPPGETLLETIEAQGIEQKELAQRTGFSRKHINEIIKGKVPISPDAAIRFERVTGVPARIWNNLEAQYQEQLARLAAQEQLRADLGWLKEIPVKELVKRRAITPSKDPMVLLEGILEFFGVASVDAWRNGWWSANVFAFRKSTTIAGRDGALATWLRLAEVAAGNLECAPFNAKRFRDHVKAIRRLTVCDPAEFAPRMVELCAAAGVALVFVPEIKGAPVSGATKWLSKQKAMICLTLRGKCNDRFWFTFFHEAGHVLDQDKQELFVDVDYADDPREQAANEFASRLLIPKKFEKQLPNLKNAREIDLFAQELGIHPGIVVGRLQHEGVLRFNQLNQMKAKLNWSEKGNGLA